MHVKELPDLVGQVIGTSDWLTVSQEMIDGFAEVTGDKQWIHVDAERAKDGPFGTTIAHGYLTLSLIAPLSQQAVKVEGVAMGVNYGLNRCRFPAPVLSGSRLQATFKLLEVTELGDGALQSTTEATLTVEGADRPSCVAEVLTRYYPA